MQTDEFKLIIQMLEKIDSKVDAMRDSLHESTRRMDEHSRELKATQEHLENTDKLAIKASARVDRIEQDLGEFKTELGFLVSVSKNIKKIAGYGAALAILVYFFPSFSKYLK